MTPRKRSRKPREKMPEWAENLLKTGKKPDRGDPGFDQYVAWRYFGTQVDGLPPEEKARHLIKSGY